MTQTDVALRLGLSQNRVSYLEAHADAVSVKQLLTWCAALGLDLELGERTQPAADPAAW